MGNADALSRLPVDEAPTHSQLNVMLVDANELPITSKQISRYTKKDPILSKIFHCLVVGKDEIKKGERIMGISIRGEGRRGSTLLFK